MLKIFNTLTNKKEIFIPIYSNIVNIYVCGITSYQYCHIGHARIFIFFDFLIKYLNYLGYKTNYIRNITDIDDKIINYLINEKFKFKNINLHKYTNKVIFNMHRDLYKLNLLKVNYEPKVTDYIPNIINFIKKLIQLKYAYINLNGDILFNIKKYKNYGKLSLKNKMIYNVNSIKNFVIWKNNIYYNQIIKDLKINWSSPWGIGRPGWHIQCSSISNYFLGNYFDIHGGGKDLIFTHHENEIAQSESIIGHRHVKYWIHIGLVIINNHKMSKSLNNFLTIKDLLNKYSFEEIRLAFLMTHYRKNFNFNYDKFDKAKIALNKMYFIIKNINIFHNNNNMINNHILINNYKKRFFKALNDDLNTPLACSILFIITKQINKLKINNRNNKLIISLIFLLIKLSNVLGILVITPKKYFKLTNKNLINNNNNNNLIKLLINLRIKARNLKNWYLSDNLRKKLYFLGVKIIDNKIIK